MSPSIALFVALASAPSIGGRISFSGAAPAPRSLDVHVDRSVCAARPVRDESFALSPDGGLANVVVMLDVPAELPANAPVATLDQRGCVFVPHVQSASLGTTLQIGNSDPVIHNVHARVEGTTVFNLGMPIPGLKVKRELSTEGVVKLSCDSGHDWMSAYIVVVPHRFHTTTSTSGHFRLDGVAPGTVRLRAWHERFGHREVEVEVVAGRDAVVNLDFAAVAEPVATRVPAAPRVEQAQVTDRATIRATGRMLYVRHCATCHGDSGDGGGESVPFLESRPRDFRTGVFSLRSTPSGRLPLPEDLFRTITLGIPGTDMPAFKKRTSASERRILARYVMTFSDRFEREPAPTAIVIPARPESVSLQAGQALYRKLRCAQCHGPDGDLTDATSNDMTDDWGMPVRATDLTRGIYKSGRDPRALYRALQTGLDGTPMPAFADMMSKEELWHLVGYLQSIAKGGGVGGWLLNE